jgi:hypothetical protein
MLKTALVASTASHRLFFRPMSYLPPTFLDGSFDRHVQLPSSDELYQRWELNSLLLLLRVGSSNDGLRDAKSAR